jgi:hypothetical protein
MWKLRMKARALFSTLTYTLSVLISLGNSSYATDGDCIRIVPSEWKEGADKIVVRTVGIDFSTIGVDSTIAEWIDEYIDKEKYTEDQIHQLKVRRSAEAVLWDTFANKCDEMQFNDITTENWYEKWSYYKGKLIDKADQSGFSSNRLRVCFGKIEPNPTDKRALLPVGAYLAKTGTENVWIIICKWEYVGEHESNDGKTEYHSFGHIRGWAIIEKDQTVIAFFTCK